MQDANLPMRDISKNSAKIASAHSLRSLKTLAAKNYCVLCGFLFFAPTTRLNADQTTVIARDHKGR